MTRAQRRIVRDFVAAIEKVIEARTAERVRKIMAAVLR
jgi:hypothetical protein